MNDISKICPECKSSNLVHNQNKGEIICRDCGLVIEENIPDQGPEWRNFGEREFSQIRTGPPLNPRRKDFGLGTKIGTLVERCKFNNKNNFSRLNELQNRERNYKERNLKRGLDELTRVASYLKLPQNVENKAAYIYKTAQDKIKIKGGSRKMFALGALCIATENFGVPRTLNEFSKASGLNKKDVLKASKSFKGNLEIALGQSKPEDYIVKFSTELGLSQEVQTATLKFYNETKGNKIFKMNRYFGIAAIVCIVAKQNGEIRTQKEIADIVGVAKTSFYDQTKGLIKILNVSPTLVSYIPRLSKKLKLSKKAQKDAVNLFKEAQEKGIFSRTSNSGIAAALYVAATQNGEIRTQKEIADIVGANSGNTSTRTQRLVKGLDLNLPINILPCNLKEDIAKFSTELRLSQKVQKDAVNLYKTVREKKISSRIGFLGIAAATVYVAATQNGEIRTQKEIADVVGVTEVTLRKQSKWITKLY